MSKLLRAAVALLSIAAGVLHWDIWAHHGYRQAPVRELFVASAVAGVVLGLVALLNRWAVVPAILANAAFLGAFALSRLSEVPTLHGGFSESGLNPSDATLVGVSTTLVLVLCEGLAVVAGLAAFLSGGRSGSRPLPSEYARA